MIVCVTKKIPLELLHFKKILPRAISNTFHRTYVRPVFHLLTANAQVTFRAVN